MRELSVVVGAEYRLSEDLGGVPMLTVLGAIDASTVRAFGDVLEVAENRSTRGLIVYLERATYLCARAYEMLARADARLATYPGRPLIIVCSEDHVASNMLRFVSPHICKALRLVAALHALRAASSSHFVDAPVPAN